MSSPSKRVVVVLGVVAAIGALSLYHSARAQVAAQATPAVAPAPPLPPGAVPGDDKDNSLDFAEGITLTTDRVIRQRLEAVKDLIDQQEWDSAANTLYELLNLKEDKAVKVLRKNKDGTEDVNWQSVKYAANDLLSKMPADGLEIFEVKYGPQARRLLAEAKRDGSAEKLAEVAFKYLYTKAGIEANDLLGSHYLDRGDNTAAAPCFQTLLKRTDPKTLSPVTLLKAALAFRRAGLTADADRVWTLLARKIGRDGLTLGDRNLSADELHEFLDKTVADNRPNSAYDWPVMQGNASRSAEGNGGQGYLSKPLWQDPDTTAIPGDDPEHKVPDLKSWVDDATKSLIDHGQPLLPAFFPVAVTVRSDSETVPLMIYRTYYGVCAREIKTGEVHWNATTKRDLFSLLGDSRNANKSQILKQWWQQYKGSAPNVLFENSTYGTLSCDPNYCYVLDELPLPPHQMQFNGWGAPQQMWGALQEDVEQNSLMAFELDSGKFKWELPAKEDKDDLAESHFLGAPLPVGGKLYVLNEKKGALRLYCIDPSRGDPSKGDSLVVWKQTLATVKNQEVIDQSVSRRIHAADLAYGEGILVCPTNAGAVLGVDLLTHSLVWARSYRPPVPGAEQPQPNGRMGRIIMWQQQQDPAKILGADWKQAAPIVTDGRAVFTAPDGNSVQCLNVRTGELLWKADRSIDDLYLGGVYSGKVLLVGKNSARALSLADGKQLFKQTTGMPSGMGVASKDVYYLPLRKGEQGHPEICALNLAEGRVTAHARMHPTGPTEEKPAIPGNLLFFEGMVLSQGADNVTAYEQVDVKLARMNELLRNNPNDPAGLTERGEVRLDKGDLPGALADLRQALQNNPSDKTRTQARTKLFEALTELFKNDFDRAEPFLAEYKEMCQVPIPAEANAEDRLALEQESKRRNAYFLCLLAKGREHQGRLLDAFDAYQDFAHLSGEELTSLPDEPQVKTRPDIWAQGRIAAMLEHATPRQREPLETRVSQRWKALQKKGDVEGMRRFVDVFGFMKPGKEARLQLAERGIEATHTTDVDKKGDFLRVEMDLLRLWRDPDPQLAGRATEALARLMIRKGMMEDAAWYYRKLGTDFATTVIRDGKTGADLYNDLATDKRFWPHLSDNRQMWTPGRVKARQVMGGNQMNGQSFHFEAEGDVLPFFERRRVTLWNQKLQLVDRFTGQEEWGQVLPQHAAQTIWQVSGWQGVRFPYRVEGHLALVNVGTTVYALDAVGRRVLWEKNLAGGATINFNMGIQQILPDPDGGVEIVLPDGFRMKIGGTGVVQPSYVCLSTWQGLVALDPITGKTLWTRSDTPMQTRLFGDDDHVYLVENRNAGAVSGVRALRASDGSAEDVPDFAALYQRRLRTIGRQLLLSDTDARGNVVLRLYDVQTGKDTWGMNFPPKSLVIRSDDPRLTGAVEPLTGKVRVFDIVSRREVLRTVLDTSNPEHGQPPWSINHVTEDGVYLVHDTEQFYLLLNQQANPAMAMWGGVWQNTMGGIRTTSLNGRVYAFNRATGKFRWYADVPDQMLVLDQFNDMPVLFCTARSQKLLNPKAGPRGGITQTAGVKSIDKRTGKLLFDADMPNSGQFFAINIDPKKQTADAVTYNLKIEHYLEHPTGKGGTPPRSAQKTGGSGVQNTLELKSDVIVQP